MVGAASNSVDCLGVNAGFECGTKPTTAEAKRNNTRVDSFDMAQFSLWALLCQIVYPIGNGKLRWIHITWCCQPWIVTEDDWITYNRRVREKPRHLHSLHRLARQWENSLWALWHFFANVYVCRSTKRHCLVTGIYMGYVKYYYIVMNKMMMNAERWMKRKQKVLAVQEY